MKKYVKEFATFPDITVMLLIFLLCASFTIPHIFLFGTWVALGIGMLTYATSEYVIHRFLFHIKTPENPSLLKIIKRLHYDHHVNPDDLKLLFLPLWFSIPGFIIYSIVVYVSTGSTILMMAFATGLVAYFLYYEWKHYFAHKPIQPRTKIGKNIKKHHLLHHFKNENYWFGVTHTSFDKTLGTFKESKEVEKSRTARNLENRMRTGILINNCEVPVT
ncbi:sterol desaturase/sphingolipid hydroxylase (fatty acid hydroxylase superfamily) [Filibacter limicola]|uniref:Sterol desaturase/sphingolipid hydroxylase (Fatty acid hydroxylase superfamily) n=1 Tax=Sporosarcina limicola TaxID=34101 RepID=A0A927R562_9BACL|nr:sterol desaturase/sphingolipid hydroxylase (fatty acid hydroxylase superfamily) [Sporosarcina limicola]